MSEVQVSIILPTYNRAHLLPAAIDSVLSQTFQDWELIIWNDGSTDQTEDVVKLFKDERVRYFFGENHGAAYARNQAYKLSVGKYIAFLDSDDAWAPSKLADQVSVLDDFPEIDCLFSDFENVNEVSLSRTLNFSQYHPAIRHLKTAELQAGLFAIKSGFNQGIAYGNFIGTDTVIIRRGILDETGLFREDLRNSEDFELWWRLGLAGVQFAYLNKALMMRYKPAGSLSSSGIDAIKSMLKALDMCLGQALANDKKELIPFLNHKYRNAWQNMIRVYGEMGDKQMAYQSFKTSLKYGLRPGSITLLLRALFS